MLQKTEWKWIEASNSRTTALYLNGGSNTLNELLHCNMTWFHIAYFYFANCLLYCYQSLFHTIGGIVSKVCGWLQGRRILVEKIWKRTFACRYREQLSVSIRKAGLSRLHHQEYRWVAPIQLLSLVIAAQHYPVNQRWRLFMLRGLKCNLFDRLGLQVHKC